MILRIFIPTTLTCALMLAAGAVNTKAQDPQPPAPSPTAEEEVEVTEQLLERFVDVYPQVLEVSQRAQAELATTTEPEQAQEVRARAEQTIMAVLDEHEMSAPEYQAVVLALRDDEVLRERFMIMLQEAQNEPDA